MFLIGWLAIAAPFDRNREETVPAGQTKGKKGCTVYPVACKF